MAQRYIRLGWFTTNVFNRIVALCASLGLSVYGSRVLVVRGRTSGAGRTTPVNLLVHNGERYLVAPRGVTQWVRNIRVSGAGELRLGRRHEPIRVVELRDEEKLELLPTYLRRWRFEVGVFFDGVGPDDTAEEIRRIAPNHPIFRIVPDR